MQAGSTRGQFTNSLIAVIIVLFILYWGQGIFKPLAFSCLLAVLLISPSHLFEKAGLPRGIAALLSLLLAFVVFFVIFYFLSTSIISFKKDLPLLLERLDEAVKELEVWAQKKFHISTERMQDFVNSSTNDALPSASYIVNTTLTTVSSGIFITIIIFIYTFLLLLYRGLIVRFFCSLMAKEHTTKILTIFSKIRYVIKSYIVGLFIEMVVVASLNMAAFFILGVRYALLLAIISAIFNIIPYLGIFMACVLSTLITFTTDSTSTVIGVIISLIIIHMIDSNILMPKIVGSKVKLNALATILGVIIISSLWGIPGTFLAVPILAVLKVIFEEVESMHPFALIMGDDDDVKSATKPVIRRIANSVRRTPRPNSP
ncbi:MAG: AI-2E family transporter [Chitinophagaceae bacterium]